MYSIVFCVKLCLHIYWIPETFLEAFINLKFNVCTRVWIELASSPLSTKFKA